MHDLSAVCQVVEHDHTLRALVITGVADVFCVGFAPTTPGPCFRLTTPISREVFDEFNALLFRLEALQVPVLAAINGKCRPGGFELMLAADIALAAERPDWDRFMCHSGDAGRRATQRLPRLVGMQRAKDLILTGRWLTGRETYADGLVLNSVPRSELENAIEDLVNHFRMESRSCLAALKAGHPRWDRIGPPTSGSPKTDRFMEYLARSPDATKGFMACREHRRPSWES